MAKLLVLIIGLVIGGAAGVWYGGQHPEAAVAEQRQALQAHLKIAQTATVQLNNAISARQGKPDDSGLTKTLVQLRDEQQAEATKLQAELDGH